MKKIIFHIAAIRALARIPANEAQKIALYAADPQSLKANVEKLQGREGFRLRVGNWRVIFDETETFSMFWISAAVAASIKQGAS